MRCRNRVNLGYKILAIVNLMITENNIECIRTYNAELCLDFHRMIIKNIFVRSYVVNRVRYDLYRYVLSVISMI